MKIVRDLLLVCITCILVSLSSEAAEWAQFRGADGSGVSTEKNLPVSWSSENGVLWAVDLPGQANSSPVITKKRVDLTTQLQDGSLVVISLDRETGKLIRQVKLGAGKLDAKGPANLYSHRHNAATPTAVADEGHTWAFFGSGHLACISAKTGDVVWQRDLVKDYGAYNITFGMGSSPRLWNDLLIVSCMTKGASYVVALDKSTGKQVWKHDRRYPAKDDGPDAYSTPALIKTGGKEQLVVVGSDHVNGYDPASGKVLWYSNGLAIDSPYGRVIASAIGSSGTIVATSANPGGGGLGHVLAVKAGKGNVSESGFAWKHAKTTPDCSTPVVIGDRVFMVTDNGIASCLKLSDGSVVWTKRLNIGTINASLVAGDGKIYVQGIDGKCAVVAADDKGEIISVNEVEGTFYATPAISDGVIYLRAYERIYAIKP